MAILIPAHVKKSMTEDAKRKNAWGKDNLSKLIEDAHINCIKMFRDERYAYDRLQSIYDLFDELYKISLPKHNLLPPFVTRSLGAYLGAVRLSVGGQICESYVLQRNALEYAVYGLVIANDEEAAKIWAKRGKDKKSTKDCRNNFRWGTVLQKLRDIDIDLADKIESLYEYAIDNGAHPNVGGIAVTTEFTDSGALVDILSVGNLPWKICVQQTFYVGLRSLQVIFRAFPNKLITTELHNRLKQLEQEKFGNV